MLPHTYSATLCWAACDRVASIARRLNIADRAKYWTSHARVLREKILSQAWDEKRGALTGAFGEPNLDASVLLVAELGLLPASDPRYRQDLRNDRPRARPQRVDHALYCAGRLRLAGNRVLGLQLLVC